MSSSGHGCNSKAIAFVIGIGVKKMRVEGWKTSGVMTSFKYCSATVPLWAG